VTPLESAKLEGSQWVQLQEVRHSQSANRSGHLWYGDEEIVAQWAHMLKEVESAYHMDV